MVIELKALSFDTYSRKARLAPVFIFMAPVALVVTCFFPVAPEKWGILVGAGTLFGLTMLFSQLGRDLGKQKEPKLFAMWGGKPTTRYLSHLESPLNRETLERYHKKLRKLRRDFKLPTVEEETANPAEAKVTYESCGDFLREKTRDAKAFPLVFAENVNYGFRRNLWAMKPAGVVLALMALVACSTKATRLWWLGEVVDAVAIATAGGCVVLFVLWTLRFTPDWVKLAADAYSERLLAALENL